MRGQRLRSNLRDVSQRRPSETKGGVGIVLTTRYSHPSRRAPVESVVRSLLPNGDVTQYSAGLSVDDVIAQFMETNNGSRNNS